LRQLAESLQRGADSVCPYGLAFKDGEEAAKQAKNARGQWRRLPPGRPGPVAHQGDQGAGRYRLDSGKVPTPEVLEPFAGFIGLVEFGGDHIAGDEKLRGVPKIILVEIGFLAKAFDVR
jgi:hypothetical protein